MSQLVRAVYRLHGAHGLAGGNGCFQQEKFITVAITASIAFGQGVSSVKPATLCIACTV
jgi:hypothetical protein